MTECDQSSNAKPRRRGFFIRFKRNEDGATAVEFAFIAVPFFALIFAIFELSFIFFGTQMLETATADSARLILTGQQQEDDAKTKPDGSAKTQEDKITAFKKTLCDPSPSGERTMLSYLFDCKNIRIDVVAQQDGSNCYIEPSALDPTKAWKADYKERYEPGTPGKLVVVRVVYNWDTSIINWPLNAAKAFVTMDFSNMGNQRVLMATTAFRNEPYKKGLFGTPKCVE